MVRYAEIGSLASGVGERKLAVMFALGIKLLERDGEIEDVCRKGSALRMGDALLSEIEQKR